MGFPIAMWSELVLLLLQNMACLGLRYRFVDSKSGARHVAVQLLRDLGSLSVAAFAMTRLPSRLMPLLCLWTVPLALFSYAQQVAQMAARGAIAPAPASSSVILRWVSSSVRVCTTLVFLGGDIPVLANHLVGLCGCSVLLAQFNWYAGLGVSRHATRKALYSELFGGGKPIKAWHMRALAWDSLGGFDASEEAEQLDGRARYEILVRKAFTALDEDGDGVIATEDLLGAIEQATEESGRACNVEMVSAMISRGDANGDGLIDFDEYRLIIAADPGLAPGSPRPLMREEAGAFKAA